MAGAGTVFESGRNGHFLAGLPGRGRHVLVQTGTRRPIVFVGVNGINTRGHLRHADPQRWMGGRLGLSIFVGFNLSRPWRRLFFSCSLIASLALFAAKWDSVWNLKRDVHLDASASVESAELRPILAKVAYEMFLDRPLWGCGYGQYDHEKLPYLADRSSSDLPLEKVTPYVQHNAFLALLVETGLLGMGLFVLLLALWIRNAWQIYRCTEANSTVQQTGILFLALLGAYVPSAMFQDTNIIDGVNLLLFFVAGVVSGLAAQQHTFAQRQANTAIRHVKPLSQLLPQSV